MRMAARCVVLALTLGFGGCSLVEIDRAADYQYNQHTFDRAVFSGIEPQQTQRQWLLRHVGYPSQIVTISDSEQQFIYRLQKVETRGLRVLFLFDQQIRDVTPEVHVVQLKQDVVTDYWVKQPELARQSPPSNTAATVAPLDEATAATATAPMVKDSAPSGEQADETPMTVDESH